MLDKITNSDFGESKAVHSPIDKDIRWRLTHGLNYYVEKTNQSEVEISQRRSKRWLVCKDQIKNYLDPLIDLSDFKYAYPTNGIHESIDWFVARVKQYQVFNGEYRYPTLLKKPVNIANTIADLIPHVPLYMSNPFSATGNFDERYDEVGQRQQCPIYLDLAFAGTTGEHKIKIHDNVEQIFWSCSKPYGLNLLRAGVRFSRKEEILQREIQGAGYFNHAIIDVFKQVTLNSSVFAKKEQYADLQKQVCDKFNLTPSDSYLVATTQDQEWDRFKRENGVNRVCLTPAYERMND
tara:strand:- start:185 stop:1063 length:879 start_codon:yes stop_codon:yes gene_type:complete